MEESLCRSPTLGWEKSFGPLSLKEEPQGQRLVGGQSSSPRNRPGGKVFFCNEILHVTNSLPQSGPSNTSNARIPLVQLNGIHVACILRQEGSPLRDRMSPIRAFKESVRPSIELVYAGVIGTVVSRHLLMNVHGASSRQDSFTKANILHPCAGRRCQRKMYTRLPAGMSRSHLSPCSLHVDGCGLAHRPPAEP